MSSRHDICFHNMEPSPALRQKAEEYVKRLEKVTDRITSCRVVIDLDTKHQHKGRLYGVGIDLRMPGLELVVNRIEDVDVYIALHQAFSAMRRRLENAASRREPANQTPQGVGR